MTNFIKYHRSIKNQQHIFLFAVVGRSSSTAFQRIVNSSNETWMWGEPRGLINQIGALLDSLKYLREDKYVLASTERMYKSYTENKHQLFYGCSLGNLESTRDIIVASISNLLKPWTDEVKRFGFKDIHGTSIQAIETLKEIYPECFLLFCFRNPLQQWQSVKTLDWEISKDINLFLAKYVKLSNTYLTYASKYHLNTFIEDTDLRESSKIISIINYLNISTIDTSLVNLTIESSSGNELNQEEVKIILASDAYKAYLSMKKISESFL